MRITILSITCILFLSSIHCSRAIIPHFELNEEKIFIGSWEGYTYSEDSYKLNMIITLKSDSKNNLQGQIDVPAQNLFNIEIQRIIVDDVKISFVVINPKVPGNPRFVGKLNKSDWTITGKFYQFDQICNFYFKKHKSNK